MDLNDIDLVEAAGRGITVHLVHPITDEDLFAADGTPVTITVLGRDSAQWQKASKKIGARLKAKHKKTVPPEAVEASLREVLSHCTTSWNNIEFAKEVLDCNQGNALQIYTDRVWVAEQILAKAVDRAELLLI
jgi:hypothetical protein